MGWGDLVTAIVGVLVGVMATEGVHYWRSRVENPAIRLLVRHNADPGDYGLANVGYASAYRVGVSVGWATPRGHFRPHHHIRQWNEVPAGAELRFQVPPQESRGDGAVLCVAWREGPEPLSRRRTQLWPLA
ncbi:hypothetical protein ACWEBX_17500 [Streptomyces sp. NPDC005070]